MKDYKIIEKCDVWPHLQAGRDIYSVLIENDTMFTKGVFPLIKNSIADVNKKLELDNILFLEKIEED